MAVRLTSRGIPDQRFGPKGPQPHLWKHGPNPVLRAQARAHSVMRCQARYREEPWDLSLEDFVALWGTKWKWRGRLGQHVNLTRKDPNRAWSRSNCCLRVRGHITRENKQGRLNTV
jgi:hypothetical protein